MASLGELQSSLYKINSLVQKFSLESAVMSANDDLITWNTRWRLQNGEVTCKTCDASQKESDKASLFDHQAGCGYAGQCSRPWDDLDRITAAFRVPKGL